MINERELMENIIKEVEKAKIKPTTIEFHYAVSDITDIVIDNEWSTRRFTDQDSFNKIVDRLMAGEQILGYHHSNKRVNIRARRDPNERRDNIEFLIKEKEEEIEKLQKSLNAMEDLGE